MTGTLRTSADLDERRRKILYRSWHRGMREMDLLLGQYIDARIGELTDSELDVYEALLEAPDRDLFRWLTGEAEVPENFSSAVYDDLKAFHAHKEKP